MTLSENTISNTLKIQTPLKNRLIVDSMSRNNIYFISVILLVCIVFPNTARTI